MSGTVIKTLPGEFSWKPLKFERGLANKTEDIDRNISATLASAYAPFTPLLDAHCGAVSIVGSGPSLQRTWRHLTGDVMACNSAGKYLVENGVIPRYLMAFDADPLLVPAIVVHPDITYLLASRCHPEVFQKLKDCKVVVWHAKGDENLESLLERECTRRYQLTSKWVPEPMCGGGSTAVTRSMFMVYAMGYRTLHLHGADSSYEEGGHTHFRPSADDHQQKHMVVRTGPLKPMEWHTTTWLAGQVEDFVVLSTALKNSGAKIVVHGDGLLPYVAAENGFDVDGQSTVYQVARSAALKAKQLWRNI